MTRNGVRSPERKKRITLTFALFLAVFTSFADIAGGLDRTGDCIIDLLDMVELFSEWLSI